MRFSQQIKSGLYWVAIARITQQIIQFCITITLARILVPEEFGLVAMVTVITGFATIFLDMGFGSALVQTGSLEKDDANTIFWITLIFALILTIFIIAISPLIVKFYQQRELLTLTKWLSLNFIFLAIGVVPRSLLSRQMKFNYLAIGDIASVIISGIFAIFLALKDAGVWSLVWLILLSSATGSFTALFYSNWIPKLVFDYSSYKRLSKYSFNLTGFTMINYWARSIDDLLIGKYFGPIQLGFYSRAYGLMMLPVSLLNNTGAKVMFPALASIQNDEKRLKSIYLKAISALSVITAPICFGLMAVADPFVKIVLGDNWIPMINTLKILCIAGAIGTLCNTTGWLYQATGKTNILFRWGIFASIIIIIGILIGILFGTIETVSIGYASAMIILFYPCFFVAGKLINMNVNDVISAVIGPYFSAAMMSITVIMLDYFLLLNEISIINLIIQVLTGVLVYFIFMRFWFWVQVISLFDFIKGR